MKKLYVSLILILIIIGGWLNLGKTYAVETRRN